jgi:POTRA domain, FtsQ-type
LRRDRARASRHHEVVSRTFAQTGVRASSGRIPAVRRPLPYNSSPVPMRSGRNRGRRGFIGRLLGVLAFGVLIALCINFTLNSNVFRLEQVQVVGTHNDALISKIQGMRMQGENIFLLNVQEVVSHIDASPLVASVELDKQLPNKLTITVVERKPVLLWQTPQGTFSVDSTGMVVAAASDTPGADRLGTVVDGTNMDKGVQGTTAVVPAVHPGSYLKQVDVAFAVDALQRIPKVIGVNAFKLYYDGTMYASTTDQASEGQYSKGSYIIESSDGWKAIVGNSHDANPLNNRLLELRALLKLAQEQRLNIGTIDLRYGLRPVFTLQ